MNTARRRGDAWLVAASVVWVLACAAGMTLLWRYKLTPGRAADAPLEWPDGAGLARATDRATIVMFAHPRCPCTRASVGELAVLMTRLGGRPRAYVVFVRPAGVPDGWERTDLYASAAAIPGVRAVVDPGGAIAARFGARVSGQTMAYDAGGRLVFAGGITPGRGHAGDNAGRSRLVAQVTGRRADVASSPVFGCSLQ